MKNKKAQRDEEIKMKMCAHKMVFIMLCLVPVFTLAHAHVPNLILVRYQVGGGGCDSHCKVGGGWMVIICVVNISVNKLTTFVNFASQRLM